MAAEGTLTECRTIWSAYKASCVLQHLPGIWCKRIKCSCYIFRSDASTHLPIPSCLTRLQRVEDLNAAVPAGHPQLATPQHDARVSSDSVWHVPMFLGAAAAAPAVAPSLPTGGCIRPRSLHSQAHIREALRRAQPSLLHPPSLRTTLQGVLDFKGGESAALARLNYYLFESNLIATYFDSRNGMLGALGGRGCRCRAGNNECPSSAVLAGGRVQLHAVQVQAQLALACVGPQLSRCHAMLSNEPHRWRLLHQICTLARTRLPVPPHHLPRNQAVRLCAGVAGVMWSVRSVHPSPVW